MKVFSICTILCIYHDTGVVSRLANPTTPISSWADRNEFANLLKLCQNPAVLGNKLMEEVISLIRSHKDPTKQGKNDKLMILTYMILIYLMILLFR